MQQSNLFQKTRLRLAFWYASAMGVLLTVSGFFVYEVVSYTRWQVIDKELESLAGTLHDGIEPYLKQSGQITSEVHTLLPGVCLSNEPCMKQSQYQGRPRLGNLHSEGYYARVLNKTGKVVATVGELPASGAAPSGNRFSLELTLDHRLLTCTHGCSTTRPWQILMTKTMGRYRQVSLQLELPTGEAWGFLQLGKSLSEFDQFIFKLRLIFLLGLPIAIVVIAGLAWWMAGVAMRPVYQSYQKIQQFTADAAHELRTPLAAVRATVEANLRNQDLTLEQAQNTLQTIDRQNARLSQMVQALLLLSRLDSKILDEKQAPCCLNDLLSDVLEEFFALAVAEDIKLETDVRADSPIVVLGNEEHLYRLVANLVMNAIHYTPPGGKVTIRLDQTEANAIIQVQDTGIGISEEQQAHIFDRFYRVSSDRSRASGGFGLGLAIAQAIAANHKGSLEVQSQLGQGSTFTLRLPVKPG